MLTSVRSSEFKFVRREVLPSRVKYTSANYLHRRRIGHRAFIGH